MSLIVRKAQYQELDKAAIRYFHRQLFLYLADSFPEYDANERKELFKQCLAYADRAKIRSEYGLTSLTVVSFMQGQCIGEDPDFITMQLKSVAIYSDPEAVICALYEAMY